MLEKFKYPISPDGLINNYDSAYHIIFTNVKTNPRFRPQMALSPAPPDIVPKLGDELCSGADSAANTLWPVCPPGIV
jgi:hypothetical protein